MVVWTKCINTSDGDSGPSTLSITTNIQSERQNTSYILYCSVVSWEGHLVFILSWWFSRDNVILYLHRILFELFSPVLGRLSLWVGRWIDIQQIWRTESLIMCSDGSAGLAGRINQGQAPLSSLRTELTWWDRPETSCIGTLSESLHFSQLRIPNVSDKKL